jgi:uncharacterized membrane protein YfcA
VGEVAAVSAVVAVAGFVSGLTAFGFALLAVPPLAMILGPKDAVIVSILVGGVATFGLAYRLWDHVDRPVAGRLVTGAVVGMPLGLVVLVTVPPDALRLTIAAAVLVSVVVLWRGAAIHGTGRRYDYAAGFTSGVLNTSVSTNGPPLVLVLQARRLPPDAFRGTLATVFVVSNLVAVALVVAAGQVTRSLLLLALAAMPAMLAGWWCGVRLAPRVHPERFRGLVLGLLAVSAVVAAVSVLA